MSEGLPFMRCPCSCHVRHAEGSMPRMAIFTGKPCALVDPQRDPRASLEEPASFTPMPLAFLQASAEND
ncbi:hypothetical protein [Noviherbaspirillum massiliense]|uniref:hypothetical protein n=1 Tax=Noviherbaspirillum massiliense TaxID=1465823 RepID=UPI0011DDB9BF|nr:hypothetical protein [Noviherbaspirillum massiliense]